MALYRVNKPRHPQGKFHVKKNDEVVILSGTQRGHRGKVLQVLRDRSRVIVEGVNLIKKAIRKSRNSPRAASSNAKAPSTFPRSCSPPITTRANRPPPAPEKAVAKKEKAAPKAKK